MERKELFSANRAPWMESWRNSKFGIRVVTRVIIKQERYSPIQIPTWPRSSENDFCEKNFPPESRGSNRDLRPLVLDGLPFDRWIDTLFSEAGQARTKLHHRARIGRYRLQRIMRWIWYSSYNRRLGIGSTKRGKHRKAWMDRIHALVVRR